MNLDELFKCRPHKVDWERVARESPDLFLLAKSVKENGLKEPIKMCDGKVLDGIHRMLVLWLLNYQGDVPIVEV